jgi:hypothetical protein
MPRKMRLVHEYPLAAFADRAGGFRQLRYPGAIVIPLTRGKFAIVDESDYPLVCDYRWRAQQRSVFEPWYARTDIVARTSTSPAQTRLLHDLITPWTGTDHANGDGLDCRRQLNLREATPTQNSQNKGKSRRNKSGFLGVHWCEAAKKWRASISLRGRETHLGVFTDPVKAALARDNATRQHFGGFGRYNFPEPGERAC